MSHQALGGFEQMDIRAARITLFRPELSRRGFSTDVLLAILRLRAGLDPASGGLR